jgi:hypothetical protein
MIAYQSLFQESLLQRWWNSHPNMAPDELIPHVGALPSTLLAA